METLKFKTTIKCEGCVSKATPVLDQSAGKNNWNVDIQNPDKILTITTDNGVTSDQIVNAVLQAGFKAEKIG